MELVIYPLGDSAFIERILNAVAMYTSQADFSVTVATAALLGVFAVAIQSVMKGGKDIDVASIFIGVGAFILLFDTVTTRVVIEDRMTGGVRVVDNVPAGASIPAYLISNIGNNISSGFETIYSSVSSTNQKPLTAGGTYADSLQALINLRTRAYNADMMQAANKAMGGGQADFRKTVYNYIKECTYPKYDLGLADQQDLKNLPLMDAIRFESELYFTEIHQPAGPVSVTCGQASSTIDTIFSNLFNEAEVKRVLNKALGATSTAPGAPQWDDKLNLSNSELIAGLGAGGLSAQQMALTMIVEPIMLEAAQGKYEDFQDQTLAIAMTNAIEQRNISWAAQASFFQETIYPMMTFFEGMSFAITPFIAFLMVMGAFGIKLGIKYFMLLIWIQLWLPLLSIVDLFITEGASSELAMAGSGLASGNSIYFMNAAYDAAKTWIGTGSYMATAVPMISLFLVSGSMYGAASLANSVSGATAKGADQAAEAVQPDAFNMGALNSINSAGTTDSLGTLRSGQEGVLGSISMGSVANRAADYARSNLNSATETFSSELANGLTNATASGNATAYTSAIGQSIASSTSQGASSVNTLANQITEGFNLTDQQKESVVGALALAASGKADFGKVLETLSPLQAELSATGKAENSTGQTLMQAFEEGYSNSELSNLSTEGRASLNRDIAASMSNTDTASYSEEERQAVTQTLKDSAQQTVQASEAYSATESLSANSAFTGQLDLRDAANNLGTDDYKQLRDQLEANGVDYTPLRDKYMETGTDAATAEKAAVLRAAANSDNPEIAGAAFAAAAGAYGLNAPDFSNVKQGSELAQPDVSGVGQGNAGDPNALQGVRSPQEVADSATGLRSEGVVGNYLANMRDVLDQGSVGYGELMRDGNSLSQGAINDLADQLPAIGGLTSAYELFAMPDQFADGAEPVFDGMMAYFGFGSEGGEKVPTFGERLASELVESGGYGGRQERAFASQIDQALEEGGFNAVMAKADDWGISRDDMSEALGAEVGTFFNGSGQLTEGAAAAFMQDLGDTAANGGYLAAQEAYNEKSDMIRQEMVNEGKEKYGMDDLQANLYAESTLGQIRDMVGLPTDGQVDARAALVDAYSARYGAEFANNMADVIEYASGNTTMAGAQLTAVQGFNMTTNGNMDGVRNWVEAQHASIGGGAGFAPQSPGLAPSVNIELNDDQFEGIQDLIQESVENSVQGLRN